MVERYWGGLVLSANETYTLTGNRHHWDTNYHLINRDTLEDHLIDIGDAGNLFRHNLNNPTDLNNIISLIWRTV